VNLKDRAVCSGGDGWNVENDDIIRHEGSVTMARAGPRDNSGGVRRVNRNSRLKPGHLGLCL